MSKARIAYDFCPLPRKRDPRWKNLRNVYGRHLFAELFVLTEGKPFAFAGEWDVFLCRELQIPGPQRTNYCRAFRELESVGLLTLSDTHVHIVFNEQVGCRSGAGAEQVESRSRAGAVQVESSLDLTTRNHSPENRQTEETEETEEREKRAGARTHTREAPPVVRIERSARFERPPLPEPPGDLPPVEPPLTERILTAHAREYVKRTAGATPMRDGRNARQLGEWCEQNAGVYRCTAAELAARVVAGLFASERAAEKRWQLSWAAKDPTEFVGLPGGAKPLVSAGPKLEAHKVWREPEWMRGMGEPEPAAEQWSDDEADIPYEAAQ